jgi:hypothetical protein
MNLSVAGACAGIIAAIYALVVFLGGSVAGSTELKDDYAKTGVKLGEIAIVGGLCWLTFLALGERLYPEEEEDELLEYQSRFEDFDERERIHEGGRKR